MEILEEIYSFTLKTVLPWAFSWGIIIFLFISKKEDIEIVFSALLCWIFFTFILEWVVSLFGYTFYNKFISFFTSFIIIVLFILILRFSEGILYTLDRLLNSKQLEKMEQEYSKQISISQNINKKLTNAKKDFF